MVVASEWRRQQNTEKKTLEAVTATSPILNPAKRQGTIDDTRLILVYQFTNFSLAYSHLSTLGQMVFTCSYKNDSTVYESSCLDS